MYKIGLFTKRGGCKSGTTEYNLPGWELNPTRDNKDKLAPERVRTVLSSGSADIKASALTTRTRCLFLL